MNQLIDRLKDLEDRRHQFETTFNTIRNGDRSFEIVEEKVSLK